MKKDVVRSRRSYGGRKGNGVTPIHPAEPIPSEEMVPLEKVRQQFLEIYSDPTNTMELAAIAERLHVSPALLLKIKSDRSFAIEAKNRFQALLPVVGMDVLKSSIGQAKRGSSSATRLVMEALGVVQGRNGVNINMFTGGSPSTQESGEDFSKLSDDDLDREISSLFGIAYPTDVLLSRGKVVPSEEVIEAEVLSAAGRDASADGATGGLDGEDAEDSPLPASSGADSSSG